MGLLPWSLGFSLIVAVLCWSQFGRVCEEQLLHDAIIDAVDGNAVALFAEIEAKSSETYEKLCHITPPDDTEKPQAKTLRLSNKHSPLTSKLHIPALVSNGGGEKQTQEILFYRLVTLLYGNQPLFYPNGNNVEDIRELFEELFEQALALETKFPIKRLEFLGNVEFSGPDKQKKEFIRFLLFRGGKGELFSRCPCDIPPLGAFVEVRKRKQCMSVYLAPRKLLLALFQNEETVKKVIDVRKEIFHKLLKISNDSSPLERGEKVEAAKLELTAELRQFETAIPSDIDPNQIDFTVSTSMPKERY